MAEAAVTFLMEKVYHLLEYNVHLVSGAANELQQLTKELGLLKAFLCDVTKKLNEEERFAEMERQIREVIYDAEDTIDSYLTQTVALERKSSLLRRLMPARFDLANQLKFLREDKVKPLFDQAKVVFAGTQIGDGSGESVEEPWRKMKKVQIIREDNNIGRKDEEYTLVGYLTEEREELDIISLVGMPGVGKTTLAWKIYQNHEIQYNFPTRIWVYVSQEFNRKDVFLKILKNFTSEDMSSLSDYDLAQTVRAFLETGKFLLVLDDVWSTEAWNDIRIVLPKNNWMGKVLITSRDKNVCSRANVNREPHMLRFLTAQESWELLQLEVFGKVDGCPPELEKIGEYIAMQCDGLPLVIVVIGGILMNLFSRQQPMGVTVEAWTKVSENVSTYISNDRDQRIPGIVALSYNRLPNDLRDCFLYLGVFPEEYEIPAWTLTCLWIAEGFIQPKAGQSLEQTAEENLMDLIDRNLVMVGRTKIDGKVKTCRVNDVIRAFCIDKAAYKEQNLFQEIKLSKEGDFDPPVSEMHRYHRLSIHSNLSRFLSGKPKGARVRSFLCFYRQTVNLNTENASAFLNAFKLLRVLESESVKFHLFPRGITKLLHLKYITLSCDDLQVLPEAIAELWNLQTLVVDTRSRSLTIKANIWRMIQLRHLKTKSAIILAIKGEGTAGENLQTLTRLSPESCTEDVSNKTCNLKILGIRGKLSTLLNARSIEKLHHLEELELLNESEPGNKLHLPGRHWFPPGLKSLTLSATFLDWKHISTLGRIATLEVLKLKNNAFTGMSWKAVGDDFHSLQCLLIVETDLVFWEASTDNFPCLQCLVLRNCLNLKEIPVGLANSLQRLDIERVGRSAVASAREIEEVKNQMQGKRKSRFGGFKLSIGPGCE